MGNKKAKIKNLPDFKKQPKRTPQFDRNGQMVRFSFSMFDDSVKWNAPDVRVDLWDIYAKLKAFEQMTWGQLAGNQDRNHAIPLNELPENISRELLRLKVDDYDKIWSLSLSGKERLWGLEFESVFPTLEGNSAQKYFLVLWWDPNHQAYPSPKKHT